VLFLCAGGCHETSPLPTGDRWDKIKDGLSRKIGDRGRTAADNRLFIDAVMWIAKTGAPWRYLPEEYGKWFTVHK
jgi:transposase